MRKSKWVGTRYINICLSKIYNILRLGHKWYYSNLMLN